MGGQVPKVQWVIYSRGRIISGVLVKSLREQIPLIEKNQFIDEKFKRDFLKEINAFLGKLQEKNNRIQENLQKILVEKDISTATSNFEVFNQFITELKKSSLFAFKHVFYKNCLFKYHFGFSFIDEYQR